MHAFIRRSLIAAVALTSTSCLSPREPILIHNYSLEDALEALDGMSAFRSVDVVAAGAVREFLTIRDGVHVEFVETHRWVEEPATAILRSLRHGQHGSKSTNGNARLELHLRRFEIQRPENQAVARIQGTRVEDDSAVGIDVVGRASPAAATPQERMRALSHALADALTRLRAVLERG